MAFPTSVNDQITDSVSQVNTKVIGDSPSMAMGNFFIANSQAFSNAAHNATSGQQQSNMTAQAATTTGVTSLFSLNIASGSTGTKDIFNSVKGLGTPGVKGLGGH